MGSIEDSCANAGALTVLYQDIHDDGRGDKLALTQRNNLGHPVQVYFDSDERWWTGTGEPQCTSAGFTGSYVDFWVATHEVGHVYGLDHTDAEYTPYFPANGTYHDEQGSFGIPLPRANLA